MGFEYNNLRLFCSILFSLILFIIFIPIIYISIEETILNRILSRIYNVNFSTNLLHMGGLFIGYFIGGLIVAYAIKDAFEFVHLNIICIIKNISYSEYSIDSPIDNQMNLYTIAVSSVAFCFASRIISRRHGYAKGKQLHSIISSIAILMFFFNVFYVIAKLNTGDPLEPTTFNEFFINNPANILKSFNLSAIDLLKYYFKICPAVLASSIATASIGEMVILKIPSHSRSMPSILEKFPSDFELITSDKLKSRIKEINNIENIESLKIMTKTLYTCEILCPLIRRLMAQNKEIIVAAPFLKTHDILNVNVINEYLCRRNKLDKIAERGKVKWIQKNCNDFRMILINDMEVLLIVKAGDFTGYRVGIYSKEPYIVNSCVKLFNGVSNEIEILSKIEKLTDIDSAPA